MELSRIIKTADGSHTIRSKEYDVTYHSIFGALEESIHVFISAGLYYKFKEGKRSISIFEMGFGTGLNAILTFLEARNLNIEIDYCTVEKHPLSSSEISNLKYPETLALSHEDHQVYSEMHRIESGVTKKLSSNFQFTKQIDDINNMRLSPNSFDVIYFDAFAPSAQSILWETPLHEKLFQALSDDGILVTYCAKGIFKRMLKSIGYKLDPLNGPARKHEMTRAIKKPDGNYIQG